MNNFSQWLKNKKLSPWVETYQSKYKTNIYDLSNKQSLIFEQQYVSKAKFVPVDQNDMTKGMIKMWNDEMKGEMQITPNDFYGKIIDVTPYELLLKSRRDPIKFAKDFANLQNTDPNSKDLYADEITMNKEKLLSFIVIYIMHDKSWQRTIGAAIAGSQAFQTTAGGVNAVFIQTSVYEKLPNTNDPLGIPTEKIINVFNVSGYSGKKTLAHELGHAGQVDKMRSASGGYDYGGKIETRPHLKYLGLPTEVGARLAVFKNFNTKKQMLKIINSDPYIEQDDKKLFSLLVTEVIPSDEIERLKLFIDNLEEQMKGKKFNQTLLNMVKNNNKISSILNSKYGDNEQLKKEHYETLATFLHLLQAEMQKQEMDIRSLFEYFEHSIKAGQKELLLKRLEYAYPRIALGQQNQQYA